MVIKCYVPVRSFFMGENNPFISYTEDGEGTMRGGRIFFTTDPLEYDHVDWLLIGDEVDTSIKTRVPWQRRILFLMEPPDIKKYPADYINKFGIVVSPYPIENYLGKCIIDNPCLGWFAGTGFGGKNFITPFFNNLQQVKNYPIQGKTKTASIIISSKAFCSGHKKRLAFFEALRSHFGGRIDYFGRDLLPVEDKLEALTSYKYHIAIENSQLVNYWTEKLSDPWIAWSLPIYCGDPAILQKVPDPAGLEIIDINNIKASIEKIEDILERDPYYSCLCSIETCRTWAINASNPFERACQIIESAEEDILSIPLLHFVDTIKMPSRFSNFKSEVYSSISAVLGRKWTETFYRQYRKIAGK